MDVTVIENAARLDRIEQLLAMLVTNGALNNNNNNINNNNDNTNSASHPHERDSLATLREDQEEYDDASTGKGKAYPNRELGVGQSEETTIAGHAKYGEPLGRA